MTRIELLIGAYHAFNSRNITAALALMTEDVIWPRAFKGGVVAGHKEVTDYWTEQWSEIDPTVEPEEFSAEGEHHVVVKVHQIVRDLQGNLLDESRVTHRFTFKENLISSMDVINVAA